MKRVVGLLFILCFVTIAQVVQAQNVVTATDEEYVSPVLRESSERTKDRKPIELPYVRDADIQWKKIVWREIDFNQPFNQFFYYPLEDGANPGAQNGLESFFTIIWNGLKDGTIKAYESDQFRHEYTYEELISKFEKVTIDSIYEMDETLGYEVLVGKERVSKLDPAEVKLMELKEVWFIDKQHSVQSNRIEGFSFSKADYSNGPDGERTFNGYETLFWVKYTDDMAVRQLMVTKEAFSYYNDADRRSYDDIFLQRYFDSRITKESNAPNRAITTFKTGDDALLESNRIKNEIMNKEIDMWEY